MEDHELKKKIRDAFNSVANGYDDPALRFFPESAKNLPACLALRGDEHVLDVATGTGHAAMALALALPNGRVTGIDFSEGMLARAEEKIRGTGLENVHLIQMDMQYLDFPNASFDAASMAFCVFFVDDMERQLRHVVEKVKPGGRIALTSFMEGSFSPLADLFIDRVKKYGVEVPLGWKKLTSIESCESLMTAAGLDQVSGESRDLGYFLKDAGQWWSVVWNAGLRRFVSSFSPADLERFKEEHLAEVAALSTGKGIKLNMHVIYAKGTKPEFL